MKIAIIAAAACLSSTASAAERGYSVTDFDRVRVDGPYKVTIVTGRSPGGRAIGSPAAIDALSIDVQGRTLVVRRNSQTWGGFPGRSAGPVEVRLTTYALRAAHLNGPGTLAIDALKGATIDLGVAGSGQLTVGTLTADRLGVTVVGAGRAQVSGKAAIVRLALRGTGAIDGSALVAADAKIVADGPGDIALRATRTADITSNGTGNVVVSGSPACTVKASGSGEVACGK